MESYKLVLLLAVCMTLCYAKVEAGSDANNVNPSEKSANSTAAAEKQPNPGSAQLSLIPSDFTWKTGFGQALIIIGATAFSFVVVGGLTLLFAPLFGYKVCSILGNCDPSVTPYSSGQSNPYYADNTQSNYNYLPYAAYQKRSIDQIQPILKTLAQAYEKLS